VRKTISFILVVAMAFTLAACSYSEASEKEENMENSVAVSSEESQAVSKEHEIQSEKEQNILPDTGQNTEVQPKEQQDTGEEENSISTEELKEDMDTKTLVVFFSCTGTTKPLAEYAAEILGADIYEIVPEDPYTEADLAYYTGGRADREQDDPDFRPAISGSVENMDAYQTILIAYPIWHGQAPRIISTFLESYDFSGKTMIPFCTSHSSGIGSSATNLHALCPNSVEWIEGKRFESGTSKDTIEEWLDSIGVK